MIIQCDMNTKHVRTRTHASHSYLHVFLCNCLQCTRVALGDNEDGDVDVWRHEEG